MTNGEIKIAICKTLGWKFSSKVEGEFAYLVFPPGKEAIKKNLGDTSFLLDFCNDLNVMNYALGNLKQDEIQDFFYALNDIVGLVDPFSPAWIKAFAVFDLVKANALQLAEAYLRAKCLWID